MKGISSKTLRELRREFDKRLVSLKMPNAAKQLRAAIRAPAKLHGRVKAGR